VLVEQVATAPKARAFGEHGMGVIAVAWQPGGTLFASTGQDSAVVLWDASSGTAAARIRPGTAWTEQIAFSPDGKLLATATGKVLSLWDPAGQKVHAFEPLAATIAAIAWDKPGRDLAAASMGAVTVHRLEPPQFTARTYPSAAACLTAAFSPNGKVLASGMQDGTVHFWWLSTGKDSQMRGYPTKVALTEWSANGRYLATSAGTEVIVWDFSGKGPEGSAPLELSGHTDRVTHLAFQPDGPWLLSAGRDWRLTLWQPGKEKQAVDAHLTGGEITAVRWSPDGKRVAVGEAKGRLTIYELEAR
jgi:WD40 repeat protein